jgi:hypothetical protein
MSKITAKLSPDIELISCISPDHVAKYEDLRIPTGGSSKRDLSIASGRNATPVYSKKQILADNLNVTKGDTDV